MPGCPLEYQESFKNTPIPVSPSEILILKSWDGTPGLCTFPRGFSCAAWAQNHYSKHMFSQQPFGHDFETCLSSCGERMWVTPHRYPARCVHRARELQTSVAPAILSSGVCGREYRQTKGWNLWQSARGLEENFQTQSIAERSEFSKNKGQR